MRSILSAFSLALVGGSILLVAQQPRAGEPAPPPQPMSFFVTSVGLAKGANLGGLAGADRHCQALAAAAGAGGKTWRAYLSASAAKGQPAVNARDRIGSGPWYNAKGTRIAENVGDLHGDTLEQARRGNNLTKVTTLNEKGERSNIDDTFDRHNILTGSQLDGTAYTDAADHTCGNWTSSGTGSAQLGHSDRAGSGTTVASPMSWNSAHASRGCSQETLFYCFAIN